MRHSVHDDMDGMPLDWMEFDEGDGGPRRELIARHIETGRTIGVRVPASWSDVDIIDALDPDYRPVLEAP